jgi:hypothetical protein
MSAKPGRFKFLYKFKGDASWRLGEWRVRSRYGATGYGHPTDGNLLIYCQELEKSTRPGGCNEHFGSVVVVSAKIVDDFTGETKAIYEKRA